jgi:hypothetical protein
MDEATKKSLEQVDFPATKQELIDAADEADAPQEVIEALQAIDGEQFADLDEVEEALDSED